MFIRHAEEKDFNRIMEIYEYARTFMAETGNPNQWGPTNWPPAKLIREDIELGRCYVCVEGDKVAGVFCFVFGEDIEPTYAVIEDGEWKHLGPYGVIHRIAGDGSVKGIGKFCLDWAFEKCGHLRIDTHTDNKVMQNLLVKNGFEKCGIIYVEEDDYPRFAYERK